MIEAIGPPDCIHVSNVLWAYEPHKYWYDILMGFKTELLIAYIATLVCIAVLAVLWVISHDHSSDETETPTD